MPDYGHFVTSCHVITVRLSCRSDAGVIRRRKIGTIHYWHKDCSYRR